MRRRTYSGAYNENMLEVHAILQRQRCNENITETTGTLSNAYKNTELNLNSVFPFYTKYFIVPLFFEHPPHLHNQMNNPESFIYLFSIIFRYLSI